MARLKKEDFKKSSRLQGLKKKINELTILCNIEAFLLVFEDPSACSSYSWPEDHHTFLSLIHKYDKSKRNSLKQVKDESIKINNNNKIINIDGGASSSSSSSKMMEKKKKKKIERHESSSFEGLGCDELLEILHGIDQKQKIVDERILQFVGMNNNNQEDLNGENGKKTEMEMVMGCDGSCGLLNCIVVESRALCSRRVEESGDKNEKGKKAVEGGDFLGFSDKMMGYWMDDDDDFGISLDDLDFVKNDEFMNVVDDDEFGISSNELGFDGFFSAGR